MHSVAFLFVLNYDSYAHRTFSSALTLIGPHGWRGFSVIRILRIRLLRWIGLLLRRVRLLRRIGLLIPLRRYWLLVSGGLRYLHLSSIGLIHTLLSTNL